MDKAEQRAPVSFSLDGERLEGRSGDTLAAALLRAGHTTFTRSIKYHRPRGPFCFAGSCGQCLVRVDGVPSVPACRVPLREGMACERQNAPLGNVEDDLFRAVDFLFPGGLDHHHIMVQSRLLGRVALEVARRLAGLGTLPARATEPVPGALRDAELVVIGAGPAGLAAARAALDAGERPLLLERNASPGGAAWLGLEPARRRPEQLEEDARGLEHDGAELLFRSEVVGLYAEGGALLAVRQAARVLVVRARRVILATGGTPQPLPFPGVDRPGVYAARGLLELRSRCGLLVREAGPVDSSAGAPALAVVGEGEELLRCAHALRAAGYALAAVLDVAPVLDVAAVLDVGESRQPIAGSRPPVADLAKGLEVLRGTPLRVRGNPVRELQLGPAAAGGPVRKIRCAAVAIALPVAPLHDLASSCGAETRYAPEQNGFPLVVDAQGQTRLPWLYAAGTVAGQGGAGRAEASGAAAGRAAAAAMAAERAAAVSGSEAR